MFVGVLIKTFKKMPRVIKFDRYEKNLTLVGRFVYSYGVKVAEVGLYVNELNWWKYSNEHDSQTKTTKRHINYVAEYLNKPVKTYLEQVNQHCHE